MAPGFVVPGMTGLQAAALPGPAFSAPPGADVSAMGALPQGAKRCIGNQSACSSTLIAHSSFLQQHFSSKGLQPCLAVKVA